MLRVLSVIVCCLIISSHTFQCHYRHTKRAELEGIQKWPDNTVFYEIDDIYPPSEKQLIVDSLAELTTKTGNCVRFVPRTNQPDYVRVLNKDGCWSGVGKSWRGGLQELSLDRSGCMTKDTIIHEFLHSLGFNHEQTRPDRDQYIKVLYENIEPENKHNFDKNQAAAFQSVGLPYDFNSIMHYTYNSFSTNGLPVMVTADGASKDWRYTMGTGNVLTESDIYKVKKIYGCA
ncbi:unnamed protein product [Adineta ricciae]|uniref:Metalloendopeptidase n=1 Tax=Adineta ricciae TaxID=249248 RepID=A0A814LJM0_ADIRI|nr:unnamed protein product [Adineta ricciae]CAF1092176.1 unnamed protein product [Adineta ricciae]